MDYYEDMSAGCLGKELQIAVPTLAIHACDGKFHDVIFTMYNLIVLLSKLPVCQCCCHIYLYIYIYIYIRQ
jgi:hypothetical protein